VERHAFLLTSAYMVRDREIKLKLYPGIAPMLMMPVAMLFGTSGSGHSEAGLWIQSFIACYLAVIPLQAMLLLNRSEHWRAAAFFHVAPLPHWAPLFHGARKAVLGWLTYPILIVQAAALAAIQHSLMPFVMALPALLFLPAFSLVPGLWKTWLPFSVPAEEQRDAGAGCLLMAIVMGVSAIIGGCAMWTWQRGSAWFWGFTAAEAVAMLGVWAALQRILRAKPWTAQEQD
jgi:ABC-2 type transport system permease protein